MFSRIRSLGSVCDIHFFNAIMVIVMSFDNISKNNKINKMIKQINQLEEENKNLQKYNDNSQR
tara:strand:+ start:149756 stop:149944 length:189 start_codon:yes stop_codon:yes gene_type:complete